MKSRLAGKPASPGFGRSFASFLNATCRLSGFTAPSSLKGEFIIPFGILALSPRVTSAVRLPVPPVQCALCRLCLRVHLCLKASHCCQSLLFPAQAELQLFECDLKVS